MTSTLQPRGVRVAGTGQALPSRLVSNAELAPALGDEFARSIGDRFGVESRYWCEADESTADLAEAAARAAIEQAGLTPSDIDLLVIATESPEYLTPATSAVVQSRLDVRRTRAFDVHAGGGSFVTALEAAWHALALDARMRHAVVVGVSAMSRFLDPHDRRTVPVYGDGAGAIVLSPSAPSGILATTCLTDGLHHHDVGIFAGGARTLLTPVVLEAGLHNRLRVLREMTDDLPVEWAAVMRDTLAQAGVDTTEVAHWCMAHPAFDAVPRTLALLATGDDLPGVLHSVRRATGYAGAASVPMALDTAAREGALRDGDTIGLASGGAGVSYGACVLRWHTGAAD